MSNQITLIEVTSEREVETKTSGSISGYACTWKYDKDGMRFERGSFSKTISERKGKIPILVKSHSSDVLETVGFISSANEDEIGLYISADFLDT
jgi:hypothetical protein